MMTTSTKRKAPINRGLFSDYDIQKDSKVNIAIPTYSLYKEGKSKLPSIFNIYRNITCTVFAFL